jgi:hypothetical protein
MRADHQHLKTKGLLLYELLGFCGGVVLAAFHEICCVSSFIIFMCQYIHNVVYSILLRSSISHVSSEWPVTVNSTIMTKTNLIKDTNVSQCFWYCGTPTKSE